MTLSFGVMLGFLQRFDASSAVNVNLSTGVVTGGSGRDTLISIEQVLGSRLPDSLDNQRYQQAIALLNFTIRHLVKINA